MIHHTAVDAKNKDVLHFFDSLQRQNQDLQINNEKFISEI